MNTATFINEYANALLSNDPEKIAACYQVPLTVYSDSGIQQVTKMEEVEAFWEQAVKPYSKAGIKKTVPAILNEEQLTKTITICKVLWKNYDETGNEVASETNFYILSQQDDRLKIAGLIIITA